MKPILCTCYWWLSDHAEDIALAAVYTLPGALAAPLFIFAASGMYENAVRDTDYPHSGFCPDTPEWTAPCIDTPTTPTTYRP